MRVVYEDKYDPESCFVMATVGEQSRELWLEVYADYRLCQSVTLTISDALDLAHHLLQVASELAVERAGAGEAT